MVLLLSWDAGEKIRDRVAIGLITSTIRGLDAEVELDRRDGVPHPCVVNLDDIAMIPYSSIRADGRVCLLSEEKMLQVSHAIHLALGMRLPCPLRRGLTTLL
jgi:mRNA-degrading endonuclease toxin of MazEF toxin-antitoxin module